MSFYINFLHGGFEHLPYVTSTGAKHLLGELLIIIRPPQFPVMKPWAVQAHASYFPSNFPEGLQSKSGEHGFSSGTCPRVQWAPEGGRAPGRSARQIMRARRGISNRNLWVCGAILSWSTWDVLTNSSVLRNLASIHVAAGTGKNVVCCTSGASSCKSDSALRPACQSNVLRRKGALVMQDSCDGHIWPAVHRFKATLQFPGSIIMEKRKRCRQNHPEPKEGCLGSVIREGGPCKWPRCREPIQKKIEALQNTPYLELKSHECEGAAVDSASLCSLIFF